MLSYTIGIIFAIILGIVAVVLVLTKKTTVICETVECDGLTKTNAESLNTFANLISVTSGSKPSVTFNSSINIGGEDNTSKYNLNVNNGITAGGALAVTGTSTLTGDITGKGALAVNGKSTLTGDITGGAITSTGGITAATGNITATTGNITSAGFITGNITATTGNITSAGFITGDITCDSINATYDITAGYGITATGDITGAQAITATGDITATGGITGGAITTAGRLTVDGTTNTKDINITRKLNHIGTSTKIHNRTLKLVKGYNLENMSGQIKKPFQTFFYSDPVT
jgi:cytoskeletal protein CcmA (bactofilin family)